MARTYAPSRYALLALAVIALIATAGCLGSTASAEEPTPESTLERSGDNYNVYDDNTAITKVEYPDSMTKTIYWEDKTVCTRWDSSQEGGVACLPFNETQIDERYDPPAN